jgi:hypothetical protein
MFFQGLIADPLEGTILVASVNVIATYVALKVGRCLPVFLPRPLSLPHHPPP